MWKFILITILMLAPLNAVPIAAASPPMLLQEIPPYAKWGTIAMKKTKEKYPDAAIVDYLHIGRETEADEATERFKLWLHGQDKEFGVYVTIIFKTDTEEIITIDFQETDR